jgi:SAM-dependent MidA family methyltransferase
MDGNGVEVTRKAILEAIRSHGPIGFDEFMTLALYGPEGYYARPPVGPGGDFVTSPHVHPVFGMLLAKAIRSLHTGIGAPAPFRLSEVGAGDGTLARQLLAELVGLDLRYDAVDISAGARAALSAVDGVEVAAELTGSPHVIVANELLDNLPFRRIRGDHEIAITASNEGDLVEQEIPWNGEPGPPDVETIVPVGALAFVDRIAETLAGGYAILIDYGDVGSSGGGAHGYRGHRVVEDTLLEPGSSDITAGVDFDLIARRAHASGLVAFPSITQHDALVGLGFDSWLRSELERQTDLLDASQGLEAVRTWGGRSRATLLVDPSALGRLRWLVLASPGLPRPAWLP